MTAPVFTVGEPSGDGLAGPVLAAIAASRPELRWSGVGGPHMAGTGTHDPLADVDTLGGAGLVELVPRLPSILRTRRRLTKALDALPPLAVFVDAPDLHLPLARRARERGIRTALLVVPQFWAWRPRRVETIGAAADLALCLFQHEVSPLRQRGLAAFWVGHPVGALPLATPPARGRPTLALLPGSRPSEVSRHLAPFVAAARALDCSIEVAWRLPADPPQIDGVRFRRDPGVDVLASADVALVAAGTATLEAAILGVPTVVAARLHPVTAAVARRALRVEHVALPNLLLGEAALPEVLQDLSVGRLVAALRPLVRDPSGARQRAVTTSARLRRLVGGGAFAPRAAERILALLDAP